MDKLKILQLVRGPLNIMTGLFDLQSIAKTTSPCKSVDSIQSQVLLQVFGQWLYESQ